MNWIQIKANIAPEIAEAVEESLLAAGAVAVTLEDAQDQAVYEPKRGTTPLWRETMVTGLYPIEEDLAQIKTLAESMFHDLTGQDFPAYRVEFLENEDWTRKWIENFKPIKMGSRLWICPSWCEIPDPNAVNLLLDPGLAFGTGTHPTTALCLQWLDKTDIQGLSVIDFGCGSGILGIAALLLGASQAMAIDNDPQALLATLDNAQRNRIGPDKLSTYLPEDAPQIQADIVLANILAQPLHQLRDHLAALTKPGGEIVLSGILEEQAASLAQHYEAQFQMNPPEIESGWVRLTGTKRA